MNTRVQDRREGLSVQLRRLTVLIGLLPVVAGSTGCAPRSLYDWGRYEDSLYIRYTKSDFADAESLVRDSLPTTAHPSRVPPGVYADYGFLLYRRGDPAGAIQYFEKEKQTFPESSALMAKLIDRVRQKTAPQGETEKKSDPAQEPKQGGTAP